MHCIKLQTTLTKTKWSGHVTTLGTLEHPCMCDTESSHSRKQVAYMKGSHAFKKLLAHDTRIAAVASASSRDENRPETFRDDNCMTQFLAKQHSCLTFDKQLCKTALQAW